MVIVDTAVRSRLPPCQTGLNIFALFKPLEDAGTQELHVCAQTTDVEDQRKTKDVVWIIILDSSYLN